MCVGKSLYIHLSVGIWVFPVFSYWEKQFYEHSCTCLLMTICMPTSCLYTYSRIAGSLGMSMFGIRGCINKHFPKWFFQFTPTVSV